MPWGVGVGVGAGVRAGAEVGAGAGVQAFPGTGWGAEEGAGAHLIVPIVVVNRRQTVLLLTSHGRTPDPVLRTLASGDGGGRAPVPGHDGGRAPAPGHGATAPQPRAPAPLLLDLLLDVLAKAEVEGRGRSLCRGWGRKVGIMWSSARQ